MKIANMKRLFIGAMALILGGCSGEDDGMPSQPESGPSPTIIELQVTPTSSRFPVGLEQQLVAQVKLSDDAVADVTTHPKVNWNSSAPNVATVNNTGLITGISEGSAIIMVSGTDAYDQYFESKVEVVVTAATVTELQVTPTTATVPAGFVQGFEATAHLSDGSSLDVTHLTRLTWSSSDPTVATISNDSATKGTATGSKPGVVTITASGNINNTSFQATAQLTVTDAVVTELQLTPATTNLPMELTEPFAATATLSDGSTRDVTNDPSLSWSSSAPSIATVVTGQASGNGLATAVSPGLVTIMASGNVNNTTFNATAQLTVTDTYLTWLEISPLSLANVPQGLTKQFTATAEFSDGSERDVTNDPFLSWSSSDPNIATIVSGQASGNGLATGIELGSVDISASGYLNGSLHTAKTTQLTVDATVTELSLTPATISLPKELKQQFTATAKLSNDTLQNVTNNSSLSWHSSDPNIATVVSGQSSGNGLVTAVAAGTVTITASGASANGAPFSATAQLTVLDAVMTSLTIASPTNQLAGVAKQVTTITELPDGSTKQITAIAELSDGSSMDVTNNLTWSSSNRDIATVVSGLESSNGLVGGIDMGPVTISASGNANGEPLSADITLAVIVSDCDGVLLEGIGCFKMPHQNPRYWVDADTDCKNFEGGYSLPAKDALYALYEAYPNDQINILWGWPNNGGYWSGTMAPTGNHYSVSLKSGKIYDNYNSVNEDKEWIGAYVACIR